MQVCVLSSGSKGNCTYIKTSNHNILIDIGNSCAYVERSLKEIGVEPKDIDMVLITHAHIDHVAGLKVFVKKYNPIIISTLKIIEEAKVILNNIYEIEKELLLEDISIQAIKTSHDTEDSNGYIVEDKNSSCVYITDTGYINERYFKKLYNKNIYIFESNHDVEKLMANPKYPHHTKIRILSDKGHLSNKDSAYYLSRFIGPDTKEIVLAHLSLENNSDELALNVLRNELEKKSINFSNITVAHQNILTKVYEV